MPVFFCEQASPWQRGTNETPTGCCASTSRRAPISAATPPSTLQPLRSSTPGLASRSLADPRSAARRTPRAARGEARRARGGATRAVSGPAWVLIRLVSASSPRPLALVAQRASQRPVFRDSRSADIPQRSRGDAALRTSNRVSDCRLDRRTSPRKILIQSPPVATFAGIRHRCGARRCRRSARQVDPGEA